MQTTPDHAWNNDLIQFARLIAEIEATTGFNAAIVSAAAESMDLDPSQVYELIERAQLRWDLAKTHLFNGHIPATQTSQIYVDIESHLEDQPVTEEPIDEELMPELAAEIARRFNYTQVYDQIDQIACQLLRERGLNTAINNLVDTINPGDYPSPC